MTLDEMKHKRTEYTVAWLEYSRLALHDQGAVFCFVEGDDAKYYEIRVRSYLLARAVHFIACNGKEGVLRLRTLTRSHGPVRMYFIDRDYDSHHTELAIFETPCYSIENFYVSEEAVSRVLQREYGLSPLDADYERCMSLYRETQKRFHSATMALNVWASCQRDAYVSGNLNCRVNLRNLNLNQLVSVELGKAIPRYTIALLHEICTEAVRIDNAALCERSRYFHAQDKAKSFRGKFEVYLLRVFLLKLKEDRCSQQPRIFSHRATVHLNLSSANLVSELSQYADTPETLRQYVEARMGT